MAQQSLGMIETKGFAAIVEALDAMLKAADVTAGPYHKIGAGIVSSPCAATSAPSRRRSTRAPPRPGGSATSLA